MAGVIMAAEVPPNSFINNEGLRNNSSSKNGQAENDQGMTNSEVNKIEGVSELNLKKDEALKGNEKSGLIMDSGFSHKIQQEAPVSQSSMANLEIEQLIKDNMSDSDSQREETGSSKLLQSGLSTEQREQSDTVVDEQVSIDASKAETNFLEDMRIFEADAAVSGQARGPMEWILKQIAQDIDPRAIIGQLMPGAVVPHQIDDITLWKGVWELITEPKARKKLDNFNTLEDAVSLIQKSNKIIILTGAGVSVSCGIPDFRSRDGIYARLSKDFPDLPDPQSMFDIHYFRRDQRPFFKFAKEIYPGQFKPSLSHRFVAALDRKGKLLRNYTQNIDTLEQVAGINRVVQCHGSFATASCTKCKYKVDAEIIREDIFNQVVPKCPICPQDESTLAVMKPDIIFFGEGLPDAFYQHLDNDKHDADLLIVIGSSLKVRPVALIPDYLKPDVPQILINREPLHHFNFDVELLGNCDAVIHELCRKLGDEWADIPEDYEMPLLGKETVERMFESSSESESEESDDEIEAVDVKKGTIDCQASQYCKSSEDQTYENRPNRLNSESVSFSTDSVAINLHHISCEVPKEFINVSESSQNSSNTSDAAENRKDCKDITENHLMTCDSAQTLTQGHSIDRDSQSVIASRSNNFVEDQSHNAFSSKSKNATDVVQSHPPEPCVSPSPQIAIETQSHNASGNPSHDALRSPSGIPPQSHGSVSSDECVFSDSVRVHCQNCTKHEFHNNKKVDRKRIIDEVAKTCTDCENQKVHERSEFSSEARLAQTNHSDVCNCGNTNKRRKRDSSCSLGSKDSVKGQKTVTLLTDLHKDEGFETLQLSAPAKNKSEEEIRGNSPAFDKASVMERFDKEDIFYLFVPPNRCIFYGAELDTNMSFRRGMIASSSEDEDEVEVKKPWNTDERQLAI